MAFWRSMWRVARNLGFVGFSPKKNVLGMNPIIISTLFIALTELLAGFLRKLVKAYAKDGLVKQMCLECVATAELCATCYELIIVADNYGVWIYAVYLFLLSLWWAREWKEESACPYAEMEKVIEGSQGIKDAVLIILAQLIGGLVIYRYVTLLWSMELTENHIGRAYADCTSDLQSVRASACFGELIGTFVNILPKYYIQKCFQPHALPFVIFWDLMFEFYGHMLPLNAYMNPVLATCFALNCVRPVDLFVVHWLASAIGALLAFIALNYMRCPYAYSSSNIDNDEALNGDDETYSMPMLPTRPKTKI